MDYLIIGQGICGTMLSWFLYKEGKRFVVIDDKQSNAASQVAAGVINPVTGRRYVYSWMIDTVMPFAVDAYRQIGEYLHIEAVFAKSIIDFFPSPQMRDAFVTHITENDTYLHSYPDQNRFNPRFHYDFGCGEVRPAYVVNLQRLVTAWREKLSYINALVNEKFDAGRLVVHDEKVTYGNITAQKIFFCNGIEAAAYSWFKRLPFAPSKGEALLIESAELPNEHIFKKGMLLVPLPEQNTFWVGSSYQWEFDDDRPSPSFYEQTNRHLQSWLKVPFRITGHKAALRPSTLERRPFVGLHPHYPAIGILNGTGTKGASLAPFFAHQLVQHLVYNLPITDEANIKRFSRILAK